MIIGVFGPGHLHKQEYANLAHLSHVLSGYADASLIVSGGGVGVESLALKYAALNGIAKEGVPPNIKQHGIPNGFIFRNKDIIQRVDLDILLWDGNSMYHKLMLDTVSAGKLLHVYPVE